MNEPKTITANFALVQYPITVSYGSGGIISPSDSVFAEHGTSRSFQIVPAACYQITDVKINGNSIGPVSSYEFTNLTFAQGINATFGPIGSTTGTSTSPTLSWTASTGATSYTVEWSQNSNFEGASFASGSSTSHPLGGLSISQSYFWRVRAENLGGSSSWSPVSSFSTGLASPALTSPANGSGDISTSPTLSWNTAVGATKYHVQWSTDPNFGSAIVDSTSGTSLSLPGLVGSTTYHWRVWASNTTSTSIPSPVWSFTTIMTPPDLPQRSAPADGSTGQSTSPTLSWSPAFQAETYAIRWSTDPTFTSFNSASTASTSMGLSGLAGATTYYWRIQAENSAGASGWTGSCWSFTTETVPPVTPYPSYPLHGATGLSATVPLGWSEPSGATSYTVEWGTSPTLSGASSATTTDSWHLVYGLSLSTTYYWRVRASNSAGTSPWSSISSFTTDCEQLGPPQWASATSDLYQKIELGWDFLSGSCGGSYFNIYRRQAGTGAYEYVGSQTYAGPWVYEDYPPPVFDIWEYHITVVDQFGRESTPAYVAGMMNY